MFIKTGFNKLKKIRISKWIAIFLYFTLFNMSYFYAPERFNNDEKYITDLMQQEINTDSSRITALFYQIFLINILGKYYTLIIINIIINILNYIKIFSGNNSLNLFLTLIYILPAIFFSHLCKEIIVFFLLYISIFHFNKNYYIKLIPLFFIAIFMRNYWFLIIANVILLRYFASTVNRKIIISIFSNLIFIVAYNIITGNFMSNVRDDLTIFRIDNIDSASLILNPNYFNESIINDFINYIYSIYILILPAFIINKYEPQYLILTFIQITLIINIYKIKLINLSANRKYCLDIFISLVMTLIIFEPDLGSFSRHEFNFFPFLVYVFTKKLIK